jgi:hypothetical protein
MNRSGSKRWGCVESVIWNLEAAIVYRYIGNLTRIWKSGLLDSWTPDPRQ